MLRTAKLAPSLVLVPLLLTLALLFPIAFSQDSAQPAQDTALQDTVLADPVPQQADAAVTEWLGRAPTAINQLASLSPEQICRELPGLLTNAAPPPGTQVRIEDRLERPSDDPSLRVFTYAAVRPGDILDVVEVRLRSDPDSATPDVWATDYVGFRSALEPVGIRAWLQTPMAAWLFVGFSLLILLQLMAKGSQLRRWLAAGVAVIREHRRLVIGTMIALYGLFGFGALTGAALPDECEEAIYEVVSLAVTQLGATDAYGSGNIARAAVTTFYQNFVVVTMSVTFSLAALLGIPAYLFAGLSFFTQGIPFGLIGSGGFIDIMLILVLLVLELTAYFLIVAGGGMVLVTLFRKGEGRVVRAYRKLLLMVPIAMLLLLVGAWYEPVILMLGL